VWASLFVGPGWVQVDSRVDPAQEKERKQRDRKRTQYPGPHQRARPSLPKSSSVSTQASISRDDDDKKSPSSSCTHLAAFLRAPAERNSPISSRGPHGTSYSYIPPQKHANPPAIRAPAVSSGRRNWSPPSPLPCTAPPRRNYASRRRLRSGQFLHPRLVVLPPSQQPRCVDLIFALPCTWDLF
jgi:hypothetical protein